MLVKAKCVIRTWDSGSATMLEPGAGPLPEGLYEIDRDGPLAKIKLGSTYCFDFDRTGTRTNDGVDVVKDYSCKREGCGKKFKTLAALGTHVHSEHNQAAAVVEEDEEPIEDFIDRTCTICSPPKVLKSKHGLRLHNEKSHPFQSQPMIEEVAEPLPA